MAAHSLDLRSPSGGPAAASLTQDRAESALLRLAQVPSRAGRLVHLEHRPGTSGTAVPWPSEINTTVPTLFAARGISALWTHQRAALDVLAGGRHLAIATGTGSGKSLAYQAAGTSAILDARGSRGERGASVLYLAPTKALAHDQAAAVRDLGAAIRVATHDGDSSREEREWTRHHGEYVLTNPDMLHFSLLPRHQRWSDFLARLSLVIVDEAHHYRGVFGAHVAQILRRLRRVAALYGAQPRFVLASATMADPQRTARSLTGLDVEAITDDASPRGALTLGLWEPPLTSHTGENGAPVRRSAVREAADLMADLVLDDLRCLAFVRSRSGVEQAAAAAAESVASTEPGLRDSIAAYRGGYLPEERREIEADLRSGRLRGLAATSALELGIDVSGLDAVLIAGFPGTRAALWQQIGRAGRAGADGAALLIARDDPLDTYLVHHPDALLGQPVEACVLDPTNPHVLGPHLCAAAQEAPLTESDWELFGASARSVVDQLVALKLLRRRPRGWFWTDSTRAADLADLRSAGGSAVQLIEAGTGRVVGTVDAGRADSAAHPGAVYLHRGDSWLVESLDLDDHVAVLEPATVDYRTLARSTTQIRIVTEHAHRDWGPVRLSCGDVEVTTQVVSFLRLRQPSGEVIGESPLDLPPRTLRTTAVWWTVPDDRLIASGLTDVDLAGAAHAAEHCSIGLLPLIATCDRWDIGGVSTLRHPDTDMLTVFVHDAQPGGAGFAARGYADARAWLSATRDAIAACECDDGCPSCVQSPKCGNQNNPLDKDGARRLLDVVLSHAEAG